MPYLHHGKRPRYTGYEKFRLPRKRASKILVDITQEAIQKSKAAKPEVWNTEFKVGDAIEIEYKKEGHNASGKTRKTRGVVMGKSKHV